MSAGAQHTLSWFQLMMMKDSPFTALSSSLLSDMEFILAVISLNCYKVPGLLRLCCARWPQIRNFHRAEERRKALAIDITNAWKPIAVWSEKVPRRRSITSRMWRWTSQPWGESSRLEVFIYLLAKLINNIVRMTNLLTKRFSICSESNDSRSLTLNSAICLFFNPSPLLPPLSDAILRRHEAEYEEKILKRREEDGGAEKCFIIQITSLKRRLLLLSFQSDTLRRHWPIFRLLIFEWKARREAVNALPGLVSGCGWMQFT